MRQNMYAIGQYGYGDAATLSPPGKKRKTGAPIVIENDVVVSLYFDARAVQSSMLIADPYALALGYTRTMVGFFLFQPAPRRISMIGLGGGSLAKYCHRHSPDARLAVVEINLDSRHTVNMHATATRIERGKRFDWSRYEEGR